MPIRRESILLCLALVFFLGSKASSFKPAPQKGKNVCVYDKNKIEYVMRRNVTTIKRVEMKSCGVPTHPDLQCEKIRYETQVYWYPFARRVHYRAYQCCPGWHGYVAGAGCTEQIPCAVQIPQLANNLCNKRRSGELETQKKLYQLGSFAGLPFPLLNMDAKKLVDLYLADQFTSQWLQLYIYMLKKNLALMQSFPKTHTKEFTTYKEYQDVYHFFLNQMKQPAEMTAFFRFPWETLPFKSTINNHTWREDRMFSDMRLAGLNPMCLTKVTGDREISGSKWSSLKTRLNPNFEWDRLIQDALGQPFPISMLLSFGSVFVCQFPKFDNMPMVPDITDPRPFRKMWKPMSPIALFVSKDSGNGEKEIVPIAIQLDSKSDSPVYTPRDGDLWTLAKESFQVTDFAYVEMVEHLLKTHLMMEPFCVTVQRHLSILHPVHQILKYHCRGLLPTNKIGFPKLVNDQAYMHQLFAIGNIGSIQLLVRAYMTMSWEDTDFRANIKARGMDDKTKVPYFPYRDDGELIYAAIEQMTDEYINQYMNCILIARKDRKHRYYMDDAQVMSDHELQALANEISASGQGQDGGKGKLRGFPARISNKNILKEILSRLIWTSSAQHSAVNYPIASYGAYEPNMPTKIYDDTRVPNDKFNLFRLPNGNLSAVQAGVAMSLGSLHLDDLFDYGSNLQDKAGGAIVQGVYKRLNEVAKPIMDARNRKRLQQGHLSYPFLTPGWVPNSICT